jgi:hypothetical protein
MSAEKSDHLMSLVKDLAERVHDLEGRVDRFEGRGLGFGPPERSKVEAEEIVVRDSSGKERIKLGISSKDDSKGNAFVNLKDQDENVGISLSAHKDGGATMRLRDAYGKARILLNTSKTPPRVVLLDGRERVRMVLDTCGDGPGLTLLDETGGERIKLRIMENLPTLALSDMSDRPKAFITVMKNGSPHLVLLDSDGDSLFQVP